MKRELVLKRFGLNVRKARAIKGLSQEKLALEAGLDRTYVGGIERGERNPSLINICRLSLVLGKQPAELLASIITPRKRSSDPPA